MPDRKILVVDDSVVDRMKLVLAVRALGHVVNEAKNGREALEQLVAGDFDLVFLDLLMPELDGFETLQRMPRAGQRLKVPTIVVSSMDNSSEKQRAIDLGAAGCLGKPFDASELASMLEQGLQS